MECFELADLPLRHYQHFVFDTHRWKGFESRPDDILICTPYKAGTTWMQMICALLVFQRTDLHLPLAEISPWLELRAAPVEETQGIYSAQDHRRIIKTHTPQGGARAVAGGTVRGESGDDALGRVGLFTRVYRLAVPPSGTDRHRLTAI